MRHERVNGMNKEKLKAKLLDWDKALQEDIRKYNALGDNRAYQFSLGCQSVVREVLKEMEEDHERRN